MDIRPATPDDVDALRAVEHDADQLFVTIGMVDLGAGEPMPADEVAAFVTAGRAWVVDAAGIGVVGGAVAGFVDDEPHVFQLSVIPEHGRQGFGTALVEGVAEWAAGQGHTRLTLTTFRDVAWNARFYERLGFRILDADECGPELRAIAEAEAVRHAHHGPRVCMGRSL